jgi:hypothetical protein
VPSNRIVVLGGMGDDAARLFDDAHRQKLGGRPNDRLRPNYNATNGNDDVVTRMVGIFGKSERGNWANRRRQALHWRSHNRINGDIERKLVRSEVNRIAGEIALMSFEPDPAKAETYFERAVAVAREQEAKSWELRAAMSMARLWRDQGKRQQAYDLVAPVYGWFTEGFDTLNLKEAKTLLEELTD